jgi:hypothetical protein
MTDHDPTRYTPGTTDLIRSGTDPWLQVEGEYEPVNLAWFDTSAFPKGVFAPVNDNYGIERDDEADVFDGDFEAALALAAHLHTITGLTYEVWFDREDDD